MEALTGSVFSVKSAVGVPGWLPGQPCDSTLSTIVCTHADSMHRHVGLLANPKCTALYTIGRTCMNLRAWSNVHARTLTKSMVINHTRIDPQPNQYKDLKWCLFYKKIQKLIKNKSINQSIFRICNCKYLINNMLISFLVSRANIAKCLNVLY